MSDQEQMYDCPASGCTASFPSELAAKGHWGGKQDDEHSGNWHEAHEAYQEAQASTEGGSDGAQSGGNPLKEGPESDTSSSGDDGPSCPECGEPAGMSEDDLEAGEIYVCSDCGTHLRWEP